jgi:hypothetical protein
MKIVRLAGAGVGLRLLVVAGKRRKSPDSESCNEALRRFLQ